MQTETNVAEVERWASTLGGAVLAVLGIRRGVRDRSVPGVVLAAAGTWLICRGATAHCPFYAAAGINRRADDTRIALSGARGVNIEEAVTINRPAEELYAFWRDFQHLPLFTQNLVS